MEVYQENGIPGYKKDRPALERLLQAAKEGKFDVVVFGDALPPVFGEAQGQHLVKRLID